MLYYFSILLRLIKFSCLPFSEFMKMMENVQ